MIYLAGPIDTKGDSGVADLWRIEAHRSLIESGFDVYDPSGVYWPSTYGGTAPDAVTIYAGNQAALMRSEGLLALLPPGVRTVGTPMEIESARQKEIPVVVLTSDWSLQLQGSGIHCYEFRHIATAIEDLSGQIERRKNGNQMEIEGFLGG